MKNFNRIVSGFALGGVVAGSLAVITGCGGSIPAAGLTAGGASSIYVVQQGSATGTVLQFPVTASGSATPSATLTPPAGAYVDSVATDSTGQIYVGIVIAATGQGEVLVYPAGSTGAAAPVRTILGSLFPSTASFTTPNSMAVSASGVLYVLSFSNLPTGNSVVALASTANGAATPLSIIQGTSAQLPQSLGLAVDTAGNVYVSNATSATTGSIAVFAAGSTGNVAPTRVITSASYPYGLAVDTSGNIYTVLDSPSRTTAGSIVEYASGASGAATPIKTITSPALYIGGGLRLDGVGNIYMVNALPAGSSTTFTLEAFSSTASGTVSPAVSFTSTSWNSAGSELALK